MCLDVSGYNTQTDLGGYIITNLISKRPDRYYPFSALRMSFQAPHPGLKGKPFQQEAAINEIRLGSLRYLG